MPFAEVAIHQALDAITINGIRLHSGNPGAAGTDNALGGGISSIAFAAAVGGERLLTADLDIIGLAANQPVTFYSMWDGATYKGSTPITAGDTSANSSGEFTLAAASTIISGI